MGNSELDRAGSRHHLSHCPDPGQPSGQRTSSSLGYGQMDLVAAVGHVDHRTGDQGGVQLNGGRLIQTSAHGARLNCTHRMKRVVFFLL